MSPNEPEENLTKVFFWSHTPYTCWCLVSTELALNYLPWTSIYYSLWYPSTLVHLLQSPSVQDRLTPSLCRGWGAALVQLLSMHDILMNFVQMNFHKNSININRKHLGCLGRWSRTSKTDPEHKYCYLEVLPGFQEKQDVKGFLRAPLLLQSISVNKQLPL